MSHRWKVLSQNEQDDADRAYKQMPPQQYRDWERQQFMADINETPFQKLVRETLDEHEMGQ